MHNKRQFLLGVFFTLSLSVLAAYTLFFTDTGNIFKEPNPLRVDFPEAYGLRVGDPVQFLGLRIGRVKLIEPDAAGPVERRIKTTLFLDQKISLMEGTTITISDSTLLGGHQVNINPGEPGAGPMESVDGVYLGTIQGSALESLGSVGDLVEENRQVVADILNNVNGILLDVRAGKGTIGKLLSDDQWSEDIGSSLSSIKNATDKIDRGEGALGMLINDPELGQYLKDSVANVESISRKIDTGEGALGALINDPALKAKIENTIASIETIATDIQAGKGLVGSLVYDDEISVQFKAALNSLSSVSKKLDEGRGLLGRLISEDEMGDDLAATLKSVKSASSDIELLMAKVRTGEGNLGKLLLDQELYDEALGAVKLLTRSLEDFREAAPVTAFTTVLFSGF